MLESFTPHANSHNAIIVAPDGLQSSFNGFDCCGYSLSSKIDDVGFFSQIQTTLEEEYSFVKSSFSYGVGWSNGGYMVMYAAKLFKAISPISGYIVDYPDMKEGTGVFFHHSFDDPFVQATGCCNDPDLPSCCCGIFADRCVSVQDVIKDIAQRKNGCDYEVGSVQLVQSYADTKAGITCTTATSESCLANNTICLYDHSGHFNSGSFATSFPMSEQVMDFFATDACNWNKGQWDNQNKECVCPKQGFGGKFCFDSTMKAELPDTAAHEKELPSKAANHVVTGGLLAVTVASCCLVKHKLSAGKRKAKVEHEADEKIELVASET
jgi:poly(3-hydroxybutyrate) depolymerase